MKYTVEKTDSWNQIADAAAIDGRCIGFGKGNHDRAQQTWEVFGESGDCVYFLVKETIYPKQVVGYVRLLCVGFGQVKTWIADFVSPSRYEPVVLVSQAVDGTVLVKDFVSDDDLLSQSWPKISGTFFKLERYPYHQTTIVESGWKVVP